MKIPDEVLIEAIDGEHKIICPYCEKVLVEIKEKAMDIQDIDLFYKWNKRARKYEYYATKQISTDFVREGIYCPFCDNEIKINADLIKEG